MCNNPARTIANIFVLTGNIGDQGREQEREGRGERPQGPKGGGEERREGGGQDLGMERAE